MQKLGLKRKWFASLLIAEMVLFNLPLASMIASAETVPNSATGSISSAVVSDPTLETKLLIGGTSPKVASFRFTATDDDFVITDIAFKIINNDSVGALHCIKKRGNARQNLFASRALCNIYRNVSFCSDE